MSSFGLFDDETLEEQKQAARSEIALRRTVIMQAVQINTLSTILIYKGICTNEEMKEILEAVNKRSPEYKQALDKLDEQEKELDEMSDNPFEELMEMLRGRNKNKEEEEKSDEHES